MNVKSLLFKGYSAKRRQGKSESPPAASSESGPPLKKPSAARRLFTPALEETPDCFNRKHPLPESLTQSTPQNAPPTKQRHIESPHPLTKPQSPLTANALSVVMQHFPQIMDDMIASYEPSQAPAAPTSTINTLKKLKICLNNDADPNHAYQGAFPLASQLFRLKMPQTITPLLQRSFDPLATDPFGASVLDYAARYGKPELLKKMLSRVPSKKMSENQKAELRNLAQRQERRIAELKPSTPSHLQSTLRKALRPNGNLMDVFAVAALVPKETLFKTKLNHQRLLHAMAQEGNTDKIKALIQAGADVNQPDEIGNTALHIAAQRGDIPLLKILLQVGANVNQPNQQNHTPLYLAATHANTDTVVTLLNGGANRVNSINPQDMPVLHMAAQLGNTTTVKTLLEAGVDVQQTDAAGQTALHHAALMGNVDMITTLLRAGCWLNQANHKGRTPLHMATMDQQNSTKLLTLIREGAEVNQPDHKGRTPLHLAAAMGHSTMTALLLQNGAAIDQPDHEGRTPLHHAYNTGRLNTASLLIQAGADQTLRDQVGQSPQNLGEQRPKFLII